VSFKPLLFVCALSCASNQPAPLAGPPPVDPEPSAAAAPAGPFDWDAMDKRARGKYMKEVVLPKMKEVFAAYDAAKYADVKCVTCHGTSAMKGDFTMPNPDLPPIPGDRAKFKEWAAKRPQMVEFMVKHLKPEMAKLLHEPEYDPSTNQGFGCAECHTVQN